MSGRRARAERKVARSTGGKPPGEAWTLNGGALYARKARIRTVEHLRTAKIARLVALERLSRAFNLHAAHTGSREAAAELLFGGMGYRLPYPADLQQAAEVVTSDEARYLAAADLYVLTPQMCDVVVAAAQTLVVQDFELLDEEDLPSASGVIVLPHPLIVEAVGGNLGDIRALTWHTPSQMRRPTEDMRRLVNRPAFRLSVYHDTRGPIQPDSFRAIMAQARAMGTPLPPLLLDAVRCYPFREQVSTDQVRELHNFGELAREADSAVREVQTARGLDEDRVIGQYTPGAQLKDPDDNFAIRFLHAFWRLCEQRIAFVDHAAVGPTGQRQAEEACVPSEVRVVQLRRLEKRDENTPGRSRNWQHRWVVRMHKVRQWYPSQQRHKVIYRGPFIKGPHDKPLLGGETVRGVTR